MSDIPWHNAEAIDTIKMIEKLENRINNLEHIVYVLESNIECLRETINNHRSCGH